MKNKYLFLAFICLISSYSFGQDQEYYNESQQNNDFREAVQFGVKIGTNFSNVYNSEGEEFISEPKFGFATGIFLSIPIGSYLGIQPEALFSQKGFKSEGSLFNSNYELTRTSNYFDVPLFISIKPVEYISILAGPQYSYLISQKNKFENAQTTIEQEEAFDNENLRKNTFCFTGGFDINVDPLVVSGRLGWDLFKNNGDGTTTTPRYKNSWYQVTLGYRF